MTLQRGDYAVILLTLLVVSLFAVQVYSQDLHPTIVCIESRGTEWVYPIDEDRVVAVTGPHGDTIIEVKDGLVRVKESPCPHHTCSLRGWMKNPGEWVACLPNEVMVSIEGGDDGGIDAFNL